MVSVRKALRGGRRSVAAEAMCGAAWAVERRTKAMERGAKDLREVRLVAARMVKSDVVIAAVVVRRNEAKRRKKNSKKVLRPILKVFRGRGLLV